jgi:site-specific DNA recombinase
LDSSAQPLSDEFRSVLTKLVAPHSRGDDSPDSELGDNILDVIAAWERKKIAERTNRGKRRKAKEGKVVAGTRPNYGFRFNEERDGYLVDEERMAVIRRIFRMVGAEGMTINATRRTLEREGILSPSGRRDGADSILDIAFTTTCISPTASRRSLPSSRPK